MPLCGAGSAVGDKARKALGPLSGGAGGPRVELSEPLLSYNQR